METRISEDVRAFVRAAVDDKFGEGTSAIIEECDASEATHEAIATRLGVTRQAITQRINKAKTYTRRIIRKAGLIQPCEAK